MNVTLELREKILKTLNKHRIISKVNPDSDCYGWSGKISKKHQTRVYVNVRSIGLHIAAWMAHKGKIPAHHYVRHICENKLCTNPTHLFISLDRSNKKLLEDRKSARPGRTRLNVDIPTELMNQVRIAAKKHNQTVTKYVVKRLYEAMEYERRLDT